MSINENGMNAIIVHNHDGDAYAAQSGLERKLNDKISQGWCIYGGVNHVVEIIPNINRGGLYPTFHNIHHFSVLVVKE